MDALKLALIVMLLGSSCKTQRPVVDLDETPSSRSRGSSSNEAIRAYLKISALNLPADAKPYDKIQVTLTAKGQTTIEDPNYVLKKNISIAVGVQYALTLTALADEKPLYSNVSCQKPNVFLAKAGSNNFNVPVCPMTEAANSGESEKENKASEEMTETPSAPGGD